MPIYFDRISSYAGGGSERVIRTWHMVQQQPSWVTRAAALVFFLVFVIPILTLVLLAIFAATVVFFALAGVYALVQAVRNLFAARDGRENVRVIQHREPW